MVFRVDKTQDYTIMCNYHLREKNMSLKAKGLLSWMLSNNDNWDYSLAGIISNCKENESAIKSTLKELQDFGYLEINKLMPESITSETGTKTILRSRIQYEYIIHEKPIQESKIQEVENLYLENQHLENPAQINSITNITNDIVDNRLFSIQSIQDNKNESIYKEKCVKNLTNVVLDSYAELCPNLPQVRAVTEARKRAIEKLANKYDLATIQEVFRKANDSDFLQGKNDTGWKGNLDFLLREDKFIATLEGRYDSHKLSGGRKVEGIIMNQDSYTDKERAEIKRKIANGEYERI